MKGSITKIYSIFDGSSKRLVIPVYQRNYDWGTKHCARLYDDLIGIIREDRTTHFFGAIVGNSETAFTYVVIDGQQRLTTTSLLMLALVRSLDNGVVTSTDAQLASKIRKSYLVLKDENDEIKFKLKPVKNDNDAYIRLLHQDTPIESSTITANYRYFLDRIARGELDGDEIWDAICRLQVMLLDLEPQDDPQRIFESINSTGLELSEADKIRNVVLMGLKSHVQEDLYENYWNRIEKSVDYRTDWFIRLYLVSKTGKTPRMDGVYEAFRAFQKTSESDTRSLLTEMRNYAEYARKLNSASTGVTDADRRLRRFNMIKHDVTLPLMMPLLGEVEDETVSQADFAAVVRILDTYVFRRFVCGVPTNALNKIFATAYSEVRRLRSPQDSFSDVLTYSLRRRSSSSRFPEDSEFEEAFATRDLYNIKSENRSYLFECLENNSSNDTHDIAGALDGQSISIEHIMPRTLTSSWREDLGPHYEEIHTTWVNRIGNLTVTGYNSSYSNSSFTDKLTRTNGFLASPYRLNARVKSAPMWDTHQMESRTKELTALALEYWPLPQTDFTPRIAPLPTVPMGDEETFTNQVISAFEFQGVKKTVKSWKDAYVEVLRIVLEDHREEVFAYADEAAGLRIFDGLPDQLSRDETMVVPGLAVWTANSTRSKLAMLRKLFDHLDIETDELMITLRNSETEGHELADDSQNAYVELTKFLPGLQELAAVSVSEEETRPIRDEFAGAFTEFRIADPYAALPGKSLPDVESPEFIAAASPEDTIAAMSLLLQVEPLMPGQFHRVITTGTMTSWLTVLAQ